MRDLRTMNFTAGQKIESDEVMKRLGTLLSRDLGVLSKINIFDTGKALIIGSGLRVEPSSGMTISVPSGACLQRTVDILPVLQPSSQAITLDAATGSPRIDTIEAQVKSVASKGDIVQVGEVASGSGGVIISNESIMRDIKHYLAVQKKTGTTDTTAATQGTLTGIIAISTTIDLSAKYLINLRDGEDGSYQEIDCRGATPSATTRAEIIAAINAAVGRTMASSGPGDVIILTGDGWGEKSTFTLKPVVTDSSLDAIFIIFGVSAGGIYKYEYTGTNEWFKIAEIDVGAATTTITSGMIRNIDQKLTWASESGDVDVRKHIYEELYEIRIKTWATATAYIAGDYIFNSGMLYVVISSHTSGVFYDDLISEKLNIINESVIPKEDDGSLNETTWLQIQNTIIKSVKTGSLFSNPIINTYSLIYTSGIGTYQGGVLAPNGDIHFIPQSANRGQKINSSGVVSTYSLVYTTTAAYAGGVLASNGDIYFVPYYANKGQKISVLGVVSTYALVYTVTEAYYGGVVAPNGDIHFIPYSSIVGQKINSAGVINTYALVYTAGNYSGGVLAPNGDIHFIPYQAAVGQKIDSAGVVSTYALVYTAGAYAGGVLAPNGDIHFIPQSANRGQEILNNYYKLFSHTLCMHPIMNKY